MRESKNKFVQFNGQSIYVLTKDGQYWIALKPICKALNVNYDRQYQNLKSDQILSFVYAIQHTPDAREHLQKMVCLPEKYIYGWLFSIRSSSPDLHAYKKECYEVLYNHFHGSITQIRETVREVCQHQHEMEELEAKLSENDDYKRYLQLQAKGKDAKNRLTQLKKNIVDHQITLFN